MKRKILYVEDEPNLGRIVSETLIEKGFEVLLIKDGGKVLESFKTFTPDICILDVMLPHMDGFEVGKEIRSRFEKLPIVFLTAKTQTTDVVKGFSSGGTDYIRKPFSIEELIARINNQLSLLNRQRLNGTDETIILGKFRFFPLKSELHSPSGIIKLSNREAQVLQILSDHINRALERKVLLLQVWGDDSFFHSRNLDVYIRKLREYFNEDPGVQIITLKGTGYRFVVES